MKLYNATPNQVRLAIDNGSIVKVYEPSELLVVRVETTWDVVGDIEGFPVLKATTGEVTGLPPEQDGVTYIVTPLVANALKGIRSDVVSPLTHGAILDFRGQIQAVKGFQRP